MFENKNLNNLRVNHSRFADGTSSSTSSQIIKDHSDIGSVPTPYDISSKQSQTSGTTKARNINLLELKMMAANRALKSSNDLLQNVEPKVDLRISPIYETRSEENRDDYKQDDSSNESTSMKVDNSKVKFDNENEILFNK